MSLADDHIAEAEVLRIRWIFEKLTGRALAETDVHTMMKQVQADHTDLDSHLALVGAGLSVEERRMVLKAAFGIASADGKVLDAEDSLMKRVAVALDIEPDDYRTIANHLMVAREFG